MSAAAPFAYILPNQAKYLTHKGREPRSLVELTQAQAEHEHRMRMADIRRMTKKLELLDALLPAIAASGVKLHQRRMWTLDDGKSIRVSTSLCDPNDDKLYEALVAVGFKEISRTDQFGRCDVATLKHGRALLLQVEVSKKAASQ